MRFRYDLLLIFCLVMRAQAQTAPKVLFDATRAKTAGNDDWVIDTDMANSSQRLLTPAQSGITASPPESFWTGAISA